MRCPSSNSVSSASSTAVAACGILLGTMSELLDNPPLRVGLNFELVEVEVELLGR